MNQLKEYREVIAIIFAIFAMLLLGAIFSNSFTEERTFLELFFMFGALLFVFSMLIVFAILGFSSFVLYLAIILSSVMLLYGIEAVILVSVMTYFVWGLIFSIEILLVDNSVKSAIEWFQQRYDFKSFKIEYYTFYPMVYAFYILVELLPNIIHREKTKRFEPNKILEKMEDILKR